MAQWVGFADAVRVDRMRREDQEYEEERDQRLFDRQIALRNHDAFLAQRKIDRELERQVRSTMDALDIPDTPENRARVAGGVGSMGSERFMQGVQDGTIRINPGRSGASSAEIGTFLTKVNDQYDLPQGYLYTAAGIESSWNPDAQNASGATGLFQFMPGTAEQYSVDPWDWQGSTHGAARLAMDNKRSLESSLGRKATAAELYLAHQQGAGGAAALLRNPNAPALDALTQAYKGNRGKAAAAIKQNGGSLDMSAAEFAGLWTGKFNERWAIFDDRVPTGEAPDGFTLSTSNDPIDRQSGDLGFGATDSEVETRAGVITDERTFSEGVAGPRRESTSSVLPIPASRDITIDFAPQSTGLDQKELEKLQSASVGHLQGIVATEPNTRRGEVAQQILDNRDSAKPRYNVTEADDPEAITAMIADISTDPSISEVDKNKLIDRLEYKKAAILESSSMAAEVQTEYARMERSLRSQQDRLLVERTDFLASAKQAMDLDAFVKENDSVLTFVGGNLAGFYNRMVNEAGEIKAMFERGHTDEEILEHLDKIAGAAITENGESFGEALAQQGSRFRQYQSKMLRFAYFYARSGLGQSGQGLSDKDFINAINVIRAGSDYGSFSEGLRGLMDDELFTMDNRISAFSDVPGVQVLLDMERNTNVAGYTNLVRPMVGRMGDYGLEGFTAWTQGEGLQPASEPQVALEPSSGGTLPETTTIDVTTPEGLVGGTPEADRVPSRDPSALITPTIKPRTPGGRESTFVTQKLAEQFGLPASAGGKYGYFKGSRFMVWEGTEENGRWVEAR